MRTLPTAALNGAAVLHCWIIALYPPGHFAASVKTATILSRFGDADRLNDTLFREFAANGGVRFAGWPLYQIDNGGGAN